MSNSALSRLVSVALATPITLSLVAIAWYSALVALDAKVWAELFDMPGLARSMAMSSWTGLAATALSWWLTAWIISQAFGKPWWTKLLRHLSPMLAVPHAAFAVGLVFLIAPSGIVLRAASPWLTGWSQPPQIATSQDTYGLGLISMLVLKEVPFLLFSAATQLQRDDVGTRLQREAMAAQTLGYSPRKAFWQIVWPQLSKRLLWPLLAVLAYGLTVVDAALIAGPSTPATLSVRAWQWLQDSDAPTNAVGAAAGWVLLALVAVSGLAVLLPNLLGLAAKRTGQRGRDREHHFGEAAWRSIIAIYAGVLLTLAISSLAGVWPFPEFLPNSISFQAWLSVSTTGSKSVLTTVTIGILSSLLALLWVIVWLEIAPAQWDATLRNLLYLPLLLPGVLWVVGLHRLALELGVAGSAFGVLIAHLLAVLPYTLITLSPAYLGFDPRYAQACFAMGKTRWEFLRRVKWPLLRQSLWSSFAVGFAVSVAQFLPTLYIGEGRFNTITTEAVTLSSGGQRSLVAAFAWLQWLLPVLVFALAAWAGKPRQFLQPSISTNA